MTQIQNGSPPQTAPLAAVAQPASGAPTQQIVRVSLSVMHPDPANPRKVYSEQSLRELGKKLRQRQLTPVLLRDHPSISGHAMVIDGHRRCEAGKHEGLKDLDAIWFKGEFTHAQILDMQLQTYLQAENLSLFDLCAAAMEYKKLHGITTQKELGRALGEKAQSTISKVYGIVERIAPDLRPHVEEDVGFTFAYEISKIPSHERQRELMKQVIEDGLPRKALVNIVKDILGKGNKKGRGKALKLAAGGSCLTVKGPPQEEIKALHALLGEALKKAEKEKPELFVAIVSSYFQAG